MLMRLSKNAFVRQYGKYTYVLSRISLYDEVFEDAEVFFRWLNRTPIDREVLLTRIIEAYQDASEHDIRNDFDELFSALIAERVVVVGETSEELDLSDESFSYDVENPKTMNVGAVSQQISADVETPQDVLKKYFEKHPTVFELQIDITQACTERCVHCYIPDFNPTFLATDTIKKVIDEFRDQGGLCLSFSGGECMLHPDFDEVLKYAWHKDLIVSILSNLTLCTDEKIQLLHDVDATVQTSLYSMCPDTHDAITNRPGSFMETMNAIKKLRKAQVPCIISCPTMKENYQDYLDVLKFARSIQMDVQTDFVIMGKKNCDKSNLVHRLDIEGCRKVLEDIVRNAVPVNSEYFDPKKKNDIRSAEEWMHDKPCGACMSSVCLDANGCYYPCPALGGVVLGSCFEHDLNWIWRVSPETLRIRNITGRDFPRCAVCEDRDYCSTCMCRNFNETGNLFTPAPFFCEVAHANHEIVDEFQKERGK